MFKFKFGLVWTLFVTPIFIMCLVIPGEQRNGIDMNIFLFIFFIVFEIIGLYMLISGIKTIIKDKKTKKYGTQCFGIVRDIQQTGAYVNDNPEYKALLDIVNPETNQIEKIEEIVGFDYRKYPINSYIQCKYYEGDINIDRVVAENEIPGGIKRMIIPIGQQQKPEYIDLEFSPDREYVTIDGVKYKKIP